ncbi:DUF4974 domain-containing protein [Chitinophaga pendula]|uniref:FecR family protein n=1 Tax=Chitinophaga TaxID=79328 RepID=UPI000BAFD2A4|nr:MULTISPECIES: FecR domain-containing protein [Chitinophaga]ASZ13787.1 hypothetical protein CK934_23945 [Chitinophaga sp. MD30]UCJ08593.1 DUF4974 domain-containing protein [Chitinophaga pendula]
MKAFNQPDIPPAIRELLGRNIKSAPYTAGERQLLHDWYESLAIDGDAPLSGEGVVLWAGIREAMDAGEAVRPLVVRMPLWRRIWRPVAAAVVVLAGGWWGWQYYAGKPVYNGQLATSAGNTRQLTLPDGTKVWLNAGSELHYRKDWQPGTTREIALNGEAFFEVAQLSQSPFIIHTKVVDIQVLGTSFNLKAYADDATVETTLLSGKVAVVMKEQQDRRMELHPHEKLVVVNRAAGHQLDVLPEQAELATTGYMLATPSQHPGDSTYAELSWKDGKLVFSNETFEQIALQLERWYGITIIFDDATLKTFRFTGSFRGESLPRIMEALQYSNPFRYEIQEGTMRIYK